MTAAGSMTNLSSSKTARNETAIVRAALHRLINARLTEGYAVPFKRLKPIRRKGEIND
jgi:hypothetical protein